MKLGLFYPLIFLASTRNKENRRTERELTMNRGIVIDTCQLYLIVGLNYRTFTCADLPFSLAVCIAASCDVMMA
jgi:hypothetical protein